MPKLIKNKNQQLTTNKKNKPTQAIRSVKRSPKINQNLLGSTFGLSLVRPFDPRAEGSRIPDEYDVPTCTYKLHTSFSVASTAVASTQNCSLAIFPNPLISVLDLNNFINGVAVMTNSPMFPFTNNLSLNGMCSSSQLNAVFSMYRLVAGGFRIRVLTPELTRTGKLIIAPFIPSSSIPGINALTTRGMASTSGAATRLLGGLVPATANTSSIFQVPGSREYSLADLGRGDIEVVYKPNSRQYGNFHSTFTGTTYSATNSQGDSTVVIDATSLIQVSDESDVVDMTGMNGYIIHYEGVPASVPLFDIEMIYHLEGTPIISATSNVGVAPVPSGILQSVKNSSAYSKVLDYVSSLPWVQLAEDVGVSMINSVMGQSRSQSQYPLLTNF